eukprot:8032667-Pyramimonas_sp.AAC.1
MFIPIAAPCRRAALRACAAAARGQQMPSARGVYVSSGHPCCLTRGPAACRSARWLARKGGRCFRRRAQRVTIGKLPALASTGSFAKLAFSRLHGRVGRRRRALGD